MTITVAWFAAPARIELIPLLLFSMTAVLLYSQELALLLAASVALLTQLTLGHEMSDLVTVLACVSVPVLLLAKGPQSNEADVRRVLDSGCDGVSPWWASAS